MDAGLPYDDRFQGLAVFGESGTGKSTFLTNLILRDIRNGLGVGVFDYHGDVIRNIIAGVPAERVPDIILFDLTDAEFPFGLNLCEVEGARTIESVAATASCIGHLFEVLFGTGLATTPRLLEVLRAVTRTLIEVSPEATLTEVPLLFTDAAVRAKLVSRLTNPAVVLFWEAYNRLTDRQKNDLIESTRNKITAFTDEPLVRHIIGQGNSTVNFSRILQEGKILLVTLSPLYEEASRLVGGAILAKLLMAGFARASLPEEARRPFMLFVDEFQRVAAASSDMKTFIHEARKFRVGTTLATQTLQSLDEGTRAAALACGNVMCFRVSGLDAPILATNFDATPQRAEAEIIGSEPVRAPVADVVSHLVHKGHHHPALAQFTSQYVMPLEYLIRKVGLSQFAFQFGCAVILPADLQEGRHLLSVALTEANRTGRADGFVHPFALFILGGAVWSEITYIFYRHFRPPDFNPFDLSVSVHPKGLKESANYLGRAAFLENEHKALARLKEEVPTGLFGRWFGKDKATAPAAALLRLLKDLRQVMDILAREPLTTETGLYQPRYQQRLYSDVANQRANELSHLPNYCCRVRFLSSGEHVLTTKPLPPLLSGEALEARIQAIKRRNWEAGYTRFYKDVEKELRDRVQRLKSPPAEQKRGGRRPGDPPPTSA